MEITIKTLTPLWTGGIETGKMDRIHETSLIGSLRWWYEAIVRGLGGTACDPTSDNPEHRCQFDTKAYEDAKKQNDPKAIEKGLTTVCHVCRLFGCTGWKRRFELKTSASEIQPLWLATKNNPRTFNHWWLSQIYTTSQNHVAAGQLTLSFQWLRGYETQHNVIHALLSIMAQLGAIGAKPQYGFGMFTLSAIMSLTKSLLVIKNHIAETNPEISRSLPNTPSLSQIWHLQCTVSEQDVNERFNSLNSIGAKPPQAIFLPVSFDIRYKLPGSPNKGLRQAYRLKHGKMETRQLFGTLEGEEKDKHAGNVFVSHLYKVQNSDLNYQLRIWGFGNSNLIQEMETNLKSIFPNLTVNETIIGENLVNIQG